MKSYKKILAILMVLAVLAVLFGCGKAETTPAATTGTTKATTTATSGETTSETTAPQYSYTLDTSPADVTVFFRARWWPEVIDEGSVPPWEESAIFNHIKDMTGVSVHYLVPVAEENEALGPMIATGDYPDMIAFGSPTNTYYLQMKEAGLIYSLTDLSAEYAPAIFEEKLIPDTQIKWWSDENGDLYHFCHYEGNDAGIQAYIDAGFCPASGENVIYVRKDILKAWYAVSGKKDTANWVDFMSLVQFAHENYADVDTIKIDPADPLTGGVWARHFVSAFGGHVSYTYPDAANKKISHMLNDSHVIDYLKWMNSLYKEGIITDTMLTETAQVKTEKYNSAGYAILDGSPVYTENTVNKTITENDGNTDRNYVAISNVSFNDQDYFQAEIIKSKGSGAMTITKNAKQPDRCIRLLEYMLTDDGQTTCALGVEGVTWKWEGSERIMLDEQKKEISTDLLAYVKKYKVLGATTHWLRMEHFAKYLDYNLVPPSEAKDRVVGLTGPYMVDVWDAGFCSLGSGIQDQDDLAIRTKLSEIQASYATKMVSAKTDAEFQSYLDAFFTEANQAGLARIEELLTQEYLSNCQSLGVTPWEKFFIKKPAFEGYVLTRDW